MNFGKYWKQFISSLSPSKAKSVIRPLLELQNDNRQVDGKATDTRIAEARGGDFTTEAKVRRNGPTGEFIGTHIGKTTTAFRRVTTAVSIEAEVMRRNSYRW